MTTSEESQRAEMGEEEEKGKRSLNFAMVIHNHQPIDNDSAIIERVYRRSYKPFLTTLNKFPQVKANLHYTGYLLEWLEKEHPELIDLLRQMVERGQVEILGGGFYEPIIPCIPPEDAQGQVRLLREKVRSLFGSYPQGFWTAERVWEPQSPEVLESSGVRYTLLDDTIFMSSGIGGRECLRPYLVESRGSYVTVFPMLKKLRYLMPWKSERETISFLRSSAAYRSSSSSEVAVFGDDGEKFGSWPTTYEKVYGKGWLENFLGLLTRNQEWLSSVRLSDYLTEFPARQRAYLPTGSYDEMLAWSLPAIPMDAETKRRAEGLWRLYLSKYPEAARLYARMLTVSKMARGVRDEGQRRDTMRELWKGQFNDVYWHGVFGGLHSPVLRRIAYHHIIVAQAMAERSEHERRGGNKDGGEEDEEDEGWLTINEREFDGNREYTVDTRHLSLGIAPHAGGAVTELDFKGPGVNVFDVLSSKKESSHEEIAVTRKKKRKAGFKLTRKEYDASLARFLLYDRYPRYSFQDFLVKGSTSLNDFRDQVFDEVSPLAGQPYELTSEVEGTVGVFGLSRTCNYRTDDGRTSTIKVKKALRLHAGESSITCSYQLGAAGPNGYEEDRSSSSTTTMDEALGGNKFAVEVNFSSLGDRGFMKEYGKAPSRHLSSTGAELRYPEVGVSLTLELDRELELLQLPVATVSRSEEGFRRNLQGISMVVVCGGRRTGTSEFQIRLSCHE